ncbi:MAG: hypothetical protein JST40_03395 [Armatimonadetes bacterium]|nr:hypothetical protein [Armatimonadota bacterium]
MNTIIPSSHKRTRRGITLVETAMASAVLLMMGGLIIQGTRLTAKTMSSVKSVAMVSRDANVGFQKIIDDVRKSESLMTQYPVESPIFVADNVTSVICRQPIADIDGNPIEGSYNIVIYRMELAADGTRVVARYKGRMDNGACADPVFDDIVAENVVCFNLRYTVNEMLIGNASTQTFALKGTPIGSSEVQANDGDLVAPEGGEVEGEGDGEQVGRGNSRLLSDLPAPAVAAIIANRIPVAAEIMLGTVDALAGEDATFSGKTVAFARIPNWGVPIGVEYQVSPTEAVDSDASSPTTALVLELKSDSKAQSPEPMTEKDVMAYNTTVKLMNKGDH